ncbi:MAG: hypothetical protein ACE360_04180 [Hyphomicrobiales bacterium]
MKRIDLSNQVLTAIKLNLADEITFVDRHQQRSIFQLPAARHDLELSLFDCKSLALVRLGFRQVHRLRYQCVGQHEHSTERHWTHLIATDVFEILIEGSEPETLTF